MNDRSFVPVLQLDEHLAYPAVIVEQIPQSHLLSYTGLACEQTHTEDHLLTTGNNKHARSNKGNLGLSSLAFLALSTAPVDRNRHIDVVD